jgi:hypothetical protein
MPPLWLPLFQGDEGALGGGATIAVAVATLLLLYPMVQSLSGFAVLVRERV